MTGAGISTALIFAAHARRVQEITDAFRVAGATAPDRAQSLAALGIEHIADAEQLAQAGVLVPGRASGTWYLDETAVVARRRAGSRTPRWVLVLLLVLAVLGAIAAGVLVASRQQSPGGP